MDLKAALLATAAAGALLLIPACGGGGGGDGPGTGSNGGGSTDSTSTGGSTPGASSTSTCQPQPDTTIVGGGLFVAEQAPVGLTLLSTGGLIQYEFTFLYDFVYGIPTNNQQDKWGQARPFPPGTPVGTSVQLELQPPTPDLIQFGTVPSTFPKGIPVELWLRKSDGNPPGPANSSSTASMNKDLLGRDDWRTAAVTYQANNTATVTFFPSDRSTFRIGVTNVRGSGSPAAASGC